MTYYSTMQFIFLKITKKHLSKMRKQDQNSHFTMSVVFFRLGTHFDSRPKILTFRQIFPKHVFPQTVL